MITSPPGQHDDWSRTAELEQEQVRDLARRIERRGQTPDEIKIRAAYLDLLTIEPGERALDVGCGSGVVTRELARRVGPTGRVVGLDPSSAFLAVAQELAQQAGVDANLDLRCGDARAMPCADGEFDLAVAITVLLHVTQPEEAIAELVRVVRPGGRVGVLNNDEDSFLLAHPDRTLTRRIVTFQSDHFVAHGWLGRDSPGLLRAAGLTNVQVAAFTAVDQEATGFFNEAARRRAERAAQHGAITESEYTRWLEQLEGVIRADRFLGGLTYLFAWGTKPVA